MDPILTQDPERNAHTSQELIPKLQVAGVPQIHPEQKAPGLNNGDALKVTDTDALSQTEATGSPQHQLVDILLFDIEMPLCVA